MASARSIGLRDRLRLNRTWQPVIRAVDKLVIATGLVGAFHALLANVRYILKQKQARHSLDTQLIVSLTSYPPRYATLSLTLKTLLTQSVKPDLIVLWIYDADFDQLPASVTSLAGPGLVIRTTERDTRSFKKLLNSIAAYPAAFIATADDDVYYARNWLARLVAGVRPGAREILGHRGHRIT